MSRIVAILTGDLIGSTQATAKAVDVSMTILRDCAARLGPHTDFTRFRGDGWQLRLLRPGDCLWACLWILARLRADEAAIGCRIAVGIGPDPTPDRQDLASAMGPAYTASGRALDQMTPGRLLALDGASASVDRFRKLTFTLAAELAGRWTTAQAQAVALKLCPDRPADDRPANETIARQLGVTRQAVDARLKSADYPVLDEMIQAFLGEDFPAEAFHD